MPKLALLDGHSLAYRAFYALPPDLATPSGQVTNAVFGFTSMLIKLMDDEAPDAIAVAWDRKEPTFRSEAYTEYKAGRETAPDLFQSQVPLIHEVLEAMEIPQVSLAGYEADDVIATLTRRARDMGYDVIVVTGDRDAFQLSQLVQIRRSGLEWETTQIPDDGGYPLSERAASKGILSGDP